jgi:Ohr subfamily peroxiredoxin
MLTTETSGPVARDRSSPPRIADVAGAVNLSGAGVVKATDKNGIRPFHIHFPEAALADLRRRLAETRLPENETVTDFSQGVPLKTIQQLLHYWRADYDWRKVEARLNAVPNFITEIDGLDIHFIHVRSRHENALPLIVTHGWPGSIIEQLKIIGPLTDPTAHGGSASDAFHLVMPSMPGYGFSGKPTAVGWGPERIAQAWTTLMRRLGYKHFVAQGGDWGAIIADMLGVQAPPELLGIHTNMPGAIPPEVDQASLAGPPVPSGLSDEERSTYEQLVFFYKHVYYAFWMASRPQTMAGFADSPIGLATFLIDHDARSLELIAGSFDGQTEGLTPDDVLDNVTLSWLTNTGVAAVRLYWENKLPFFQSEGRQSPDSRERLPGRTLPDAPDLGGARLSQADSLQQARAGRPLRRLGTAEAFCRRASRGFQILAQIGLKDVGGRNTHADPFFNHQAKTTPPIPFRQFEARAHIAREPQILWCRAQPPKKKYAMNHNTRVLHTAKTETTGGREHGSSRSSDGLLDIRLSNPGSARIGTNPEQLFAAGWSASFASAIALAAREKNVALPARVSINAEVDLNLEDGGYFLSARLNVRLAGLERKVAERLIKRAEKICPYSKATRGSIDITIKVV